MHKHNRFQFVILACLALTVIPSCGPSPTPRAATKRSQDLTNRAGQPTGTVPLASIPVLQYVLPSQTDFTIDPQVEFDGYFYVFTVKTKNGKTQKIHSVRRLVKACHEINVTEHYKRENPGGHIASGFGESAKGVGKGLFNIIRHPGQTVKNVGQTTKNVFVRAGQVGKTTKSSSGEDLALLGKGPAGTERRRLAYRLGIDVYTESELARETLNSIARQRMAGKLPVNSAVFALPGGVVFTLALTPAGYDISTESLIRDKDPGSLMYELANLYTQEFGFDTKSPNSAVNSLLANGNFTPRQQAYLLLYCKDMRNVAGLESAISFLAKASSPEYASIVTAQMELLSLLHQRARPLKKLLPVRNTVGALSQDNVLMFVISIDTVRYWNDVRLSLQAAQTTGQRENAAAVEIWSTGDIDSRSVNEARNMGIRVMQNILAHEVFRRPRQDMGGQEKMPTPRRQPARKTNQVTPRNTQPAPSTPPPAAPPRARQATRRPPILP